MNIFFTIAPYGIRVTRLYQLFIVMLADGTMQLNTVRPHSNGIDLDLDLDLDLDQHEHTRNARRVFIRVFIKLYTRNHSATVLYEWRARCRRGWNRLWPVMFDKLLW